MEERLAERSITLTLSESALDYLTDVGFDPVYGARPLKRTISKNLETRVAKGILKGEIGDGDTVVVEMKNGVLDISKAYDVNGEVLSGAGDFN